MTDDQKRYSMKDLVRRTGFTERRIRYYITQKLVPKAGCRGPHVRYGQEVLDRLLLVRQLKTKRIQPTGRRLTLQEIKRAIETLAAQDVASLISGKAELAILDTDSGRLRPWRFPDGDEPTMAAATQVHDEPRMIRRRLHLHPEEEMCEAMVCESPIAYRELAQTAEPLHLGELEKILRGLQSLCADISGQEVDKTDGEGEAWRRTGTSGIEIHVQLPQDEAHRRRLDEISRALAILLQGEEKS